VAGAAAVVNTSCHFSNCLKPDSGYVGDAPPALLLAAAQPNLTCMCVRVRVCVCVRCVRCVRRVGGKQIRVRGGSSRASTLRR
jgi:hypothetical protein